MKKKNIIIPILLVGICLISFFYLLFPKISFSQDNTVLEKGVKYNAQDFVEKANGEVIPENDFLYTDKVGVYSLNYKVRKWFIERDATFFYTVIDTTPPVITIKQQTISVDPDILLSEDDIRNNVSLDEGTFTYESDYDPLYAGNYVVYIEAKDEFNNMSHNRFEIIVNDIEPPLILRSGNGTVIEKGDKFNILDYISYGDNADPKPELSVKGYVNTNRRGFYNLEATLSDASNNQTSWDIQVEVVDRIPRDDSDDDYVYSFEEFKKEYSAPGRKFGIDVSEWQDEIDFEAVKKAGCEFVIMRIGFSHEGVLTLDQCFKQNIEDAKQAGLPVGVYLFCYDNSKEYLLSSLEEVFEQLKDYELELPIVFDWENFSRFQNYEMSFQELNKLYDVFEKEVNSRGYQSMLYGSSYYLRTLWKHLDSRPVWLAVYADWPTYEYPYEFWQLTDHGNIDGINGYVDFNIQFVMP